MADISQIKLPSGDTFDIIDEKSGYIKTSIYHGTSASAAADTTKVVTCENFTSSDLKAGAAILVTFSTTNSAAVASLALNVNGTGVKNVKYINNGTLGNLSSAGYLKANTTYLFIYDGTYWVAYFNYNTTYSLMSEAEARAGTATTARTVSAVRLKDTIDYTLENKTDYSIPVSRVGEIVVGETAIGTDSTNFPTSKAVVDYVDERVVQEIDAIDVGVTGIKADGRSLSVVDGVVNIPVISSNQSVGLMTQDVLDTFANYIQSSIPTSTSQLTNDSGFITSETDPVFSASAAAGITSTDISNWNSKTSNTGTITRVKTTAGAHTVIDVTSGAANFNVPTKTSHLTNDSGFITTPGLEKTFIDGNYEGGARWVPGDVNTEATLQLDLGEDNNTYAALSLGSAGSIILDSFDGNSSITFEILPGEVDYYINQSAQVNFPLPSSGTHTIALTSDIPTVYSSTNTGGYLTMATLPIYNGTVV